MKMLKHASYPLVITTRYSVPKKMKGQLTAHWKMRDAEGFILNNDGNKSACVHQWDRFYSELRKFIDTKTYPDKSAEELITEIDKLANYIHK